MYLSVGKATANYWLILPFVVFSSPISVVVEVFAAVVVKMFSIFLLSEKKNPKFKKRNCKKNGISNKNTALFKDLSSVL